MSARAENRVPPRCGTVFRGGRCERRIICFPRRRYALFRACTRVYSHKGRSSDTRTYIYIYIYMCVYTTRVSHVGCPTRSKSRQNFAPGVFNSKLPGDREGRHCAYNGNFGVNRGNASERKSTQTCWKYFLTTTKRMTLRDSVSWNTITAFIYRQSANV